MCYRTRGLSNEQDLIKLKDKVELIGNLRRPAVQWGKDYAQEASREEHGGCHPCRGGGGVS